jgi:hypothetical protein
MGEHRHNPRAQEAALPREMFRPGDEIIGFELKAVLELNKEKLAEAVQIIDTAKASGQDPRFAVPKWNPKENPEFFDVVVYNFLQLGRPSALAIDPSRIPMATMRWSEHMRVPFPELRSRADEAFAGAEASGQERH